MHVHVERDDKIAKVWLEPLRLCNSGGFNRSELSKILRTIEQNREIMMEAWNDYFNG